MSLPLLNFCFFDERRRSSVGLAALAKMPEARSLRACTRARAYSRGLSLPMRARISAVEELDTAGSPEIQILKSITIKRPTVRAF